MCGLIDYQIDIDRRPVTAGTNYATYQLAPLSRAVPEIMICIILTRVIKYARMRIVQSLI